MTSDPYSLNLPEDHAMYAAVIANGQVLSSVWRVWSKDDDIYLGVPTLRGDFKTSLHASGKFRHAFTNKKVAAKFLGSGRDRAVEKWNRPPPTPEGVVWLMQVAIPGAGLGAHLDRYLISDMTKPLPVPNGNELLLLSVLLMPPELIGRSIGIDDRALHVLDSWLLKNGRVVAVTWDLQHLPMGLAQVMKAMSSEVGAAKQAAASDPYCDVRLNIPITLSSGGARAILDCEADALESWTKGVDDT